MWIFAVFTKFIPLVEVAVCTCVNPLLHFQKLQMETNERQATIHFDTVASAHKFFNKYRRYMIDLSMIQVDLVPCEGNS